MSQLPDTTIQLVLSFFEPRDLLSALMCSNLFKNLITLRMVMESALMNGGDARVSMIRIYKLMEKRSIFPPSALRLLRIATGKRCETCFNIKKCICIDMWIYDTLHGVI